MSALISTAGSRTTHAWWPNAFANKAATQYTPNGW